MTSYAIISLGGKQYRVHEGQRLLVDRLAADEGKTFHPDILLLGGNGSTDLAPKGVTVTARVVRHLRGPKIRIGKYRPKSGYRRHTGFRASLSQIEIEAIGARKSAAKPKAEQAAAPQAEEQAKPARRQAHPPKGYDEMTVEQIAEAAPGWRRPNLEAALEHERANAKRKGAISALESALAATEES